MFAVGPLCPMARRRAGRGVALVLAGALCLGTLPGCRRREAPVIQGVREEIVVEAGEPLNQILLEGVTAVRGEGEKQETLPVNATVYDQSGGPVSRVLPGTYRVEYSSSEGAESVTAVLVVRPADQEPPVIEGAVDLSAEVGESPSYRSGVHAVDNRDGEVPLQVDASQVDLSQPGEYSVVYSAQDSHGNLAQESVTLTVIEAVDVDAPIPEEPEPERETTQPEGTDAPTQQSDSGEVTAEKLHALADGILAKITNDGMSQRQKARAIYDYVRTHITYVGTSDKSSWIKGAYVGFTRGRGDCFNYFACSKELLTRAGIPNVDLYRVGGTTDHYWQLVNVGDGYYHFDACPHPNRFPVASFMLTESEVRAYTVRCSSVRKNYYVYNYDACPVSVVWGNAEINPPAPKPQPVTPVEEQPPEEAEGIPPEEAELPEGETLPEETESQEGETLPEEMEPQEGETPPEETGTQEGETPPEAEEQPEQAEEPGTETLEEEPPEEAAQDPEEPEESLPEPQEPEVQPEQDPAQEEKPTPTPPEPSPEPEPPVLEVIPMAPETDEEADIPVVD